MNVIITDKNHPHYGEAGRMTGEVITVLGKQMAKVELTGCQHGGDACYVSKGQVSRLAERELYAPRPKERAKTSPNDQSGIYHWVITVNGWGTRYAIGTEQQAEEWRAHKANWERGVAIKRLASEKEREFYKFEPL
jgi:hypothetical protein